jgi:hypothetical protein
MKQLLAAIPVLLFLAACAPAAPSPTPQVIDIYATAAAQPWLADLYDCAGEQSVILRLSESPSDAEILLRVGQPDDLSTPSYQIATEEILIVTNRESPVQNLSAEQARALFAGRLAPAGSRPERGSGTEGVQVWVFAPAEDVQQIFENVLMQGTPITSLAQLAATPQQMSDTLNGEKNVVGILPRHWKAGSARDVFTVAEVPVLAIVKEEPHGAIKALLTCLQK